MPARCSSTIPSPVPASSFGSFDERGEGPDQRGPFWFPVGAALLVLSTGLLAAWAWLDGPSSLVHFVPIFAVSTALTVLTGFAQTLFAYLKADPAIKQQLCREGTGDRSWLHLIRPWYGHAAHMHIRFRCPEGQPDCIQAPPPPAGDGCDTTLQWWFDQLDAPAKPSSPSKPPPLPAACTVILSGGG